ncbi:adhesin, partial [Burkholderia cenocepacia]|nr:adhesin [Burkholderia cenocepacia]
SVATGTGAVALGANNTASGNGALAIGNANSAQGLGSVALGQNSIAGTSPTAVGGVAIGNGATATASAGDVALGSGSVTAVANPTATGTIGGVTYNYAGTTPSSVVSVGAPGAERQVTNVAAGRVMATSTDAINGSQLYATNTAIDSL